MEKFGSITLTHKVEVFNNEIGHVFDLFYDYGLKYHYWISVAIEKDRIDTEVNCTEIIDTDLISLDHLFDDPKNQRKHKYNFTLPIVNDGTAINEELCRALTKSLYISNLITARDCVLDDEEYQEVNSYEISDLKLSTSFQKLFKAMEKYVISIMNSEMNLEEFLEV